MARRAAGADDMPSSCSKDLKAHCKGARSQLHCLGKNADTISAGCRADVGKSVPFLCSNGIDRWCDVLLGGILSCLSDHMSDLEGPCKDAVTATRHVITKVNTQKASVVDPSTGEKKSVAPKKSTTQREALLDASLRGLTQAAGTSLTQTGAAAPARNLETKDKPRTMNIASPGK